MRVDLFDFDLPEERIALRPAVPREAARLLCVAASGSLADRTVGDLPGLCRPGDVLVFNDTRVIPARLSGIRRREGVTTGDGVARIEATLHMRLDPDRWKAFLRPAKRVKAGDRIVFGAEEGGACLMGRLVAEVEERGEAGEATLRFELAGPVLDEAIAAIGHIPLPPYIASKRPDDEADRRDYQTIFAKNSGAVAAPTAGLHFTPELMQRFEAGGVGVEFLTLHVGAGTFLPVKAEDTAEHRMHAEIGHVDAATAERLNEARRRGGRIVAVGTTSLRLLESAAGGDGVIRPFAGATDIFITPGYRFRAVDRLVTNFHLPRSTLFMLVSAFSGLDTMRSAYAHAVATGYRFYSYGDACLLDRAT
ncbi:tRNA preQ1(34) S-adenosylmethionine ribosyltransferase-isomerase QueA [Jiella sonneratiae]|uniref:S-adenosylmethionine:tRNA ribosyltransferase-isomerase n=1 Tax=Jiella sonneratiae TaxID=2816856 RepID=A0ABS3IYB0_9HYPH|nr:tRNA preQ1(34) S-adenosylmethionine ribosyltransferase-isomerase QueA [Jiella sonneratiae]MBO0902379.1 tRNA preQ1(34) S-adenosylmethionine ribosyltransferase-isomerase QueA [Jiella sonneratiae]